MKTFPWKYVLTSILAFTLASVALTYAIAFVVHTFPGNHLSYHEVLPAGLLFGLAVSTVIISRQYEFINTNEGEVTDKNIFPKRTAVFRKKMSLSDIRAYLKNLEERRDTWELKEEKRRRLIFKVRSDRGPSSFVILKLKPKKKHIKISCTIKNSLPLLPVDYGHTHECLHDLEDYIDKG